MNNLCTITPSPLLWYGVLSMTGRVLLFCIGGLVFMHQMARTATAHTQVMQRRRYEAFPECEEEDREIDALVQVELRRMPWWRWEGARLQQRHKCRMLPLLQPLLRIGLVLGLDTRRWTG